MPRVRKAIRQLREDEAGAALIEYTVLIGVITGAVMVSVLAIGTWASGRWADLAASL
jgi:pilus assembly protein Flp/PilA